jgi:chromosome segregation ATPase
MVVQPETAIEPAEEGANIQELQRIAEMGEAIAHMARQQIEFQQQQEQLTRRLNKAGQIVKSIQGDVADVQEDVADIQIRLGTVEDKLHPHAYITDEQAAEVSTVVKALAEMLTRQEKGKNHYQGIFAELHRRFGVPSYKHIRQEQYDAVLAFLDDWRNAAVAGQEFPTD